MADRNRVRVILDCTSSTGCHFCGSSGHGPSAVLVCVQFKWPPGEQNELHVCFRCADKIATVADGGVDD